MHIMQIDDRKYDKLNENSDHLPQFCHIHDVYD